MNEDAGSNGNTLPREPTQYWRGLCSRLESQIRQLELFLDLPRGRAGSVAGAAAERGYERLLRLRRVRAKVAARGRFEVIKLAS